MVKIKRLRETLYKKLDDKDVNEILRVSKELDKEIVKYYMLKFCFDLNIY